MSDGERDKRGFFPSSQKEKSFCGRSWSIHWEAQWGGEEEEEEQCLVSSTDCGFDKAVLSICQGCRIACGVLFVSC